MNSWCFGSGLSLSPQLITPTINSPVEEVCHLASSSTAGHINGCGQQCWSQCVFQSFPVLQGFGISYGELTGLCPPLPAQSAQFRARTQTVPLSGRDKWIIIRRDFHGFSMSSIFSRAFSGTFDFFFSDHIAVQWCHIWAMLLAECSHLPLEWGKMHPSVLFF